MPHAVDELGGDLERVRSTEGQMARVEADVRLRAVEHTLDVLVLLDHCPPVGMEHVDDPVLAGRGVQGGECGQQVRPLRVAQIDARRPVVVDDCGGAENRRSEVREQGCGAVHLRERRVEGSRVVEHDGQEPAHELQVVPVEQLSGCSRVVPEVAVGAGLGGDDPQRPHLCEHAVGRELDAPARHLADPPRDRTGGEAFEDG